MGDNHSLDLILASYFPFSTLKSLTEIRTFWQLFTWYNTLNHINVETNLQAKTKTGQAGTILISRKLNFQ